MGPETPSNGPNAIVSSAIWGVGGAVSAQAADFLGRRITLIRERLNQAIPDSVQEQMSSVAFRIGRVASCLCRPLVSERNIMTYSNYSYFVAPVTEEVVFRLILQEGSSLALQSLGIPSSIAKVMTIATTSCLFGLAHDANIQSEQFASTALQGVAFGVAQAENGIAAAIIAHGVSNWIMDQRG